MASSCAQVMPVPCSHDARAAGRHCQRTPSNQLRNRAESYGAGSSALPRHRSMSTVPLQSCYRQGNQQIVAVVKLPPGAGSTVDQ